MEPYIVHKREPSRGRHFSRPGRPSRGGQGGHSTHPARDRRGAGSGYGGYGRRAGAPSRPRRSAQRGENIDVSRFVNKAVVEESEIYEPQHSFADFAINETLKKNIIHKGYQTPTPIQDRAIPRALQGHDIVGIADTGTGKTAAFLIPLIDKVLRDPSQRVLIMVPTRELALQIEDEYWGFASHLRIGIVSLVGGAGINPQIATLRRKPNFVVGTPGRIKDVMERRALDLSAFSTLVLDEADRMLDMGFIADMKFIVSQMPKREHTLFFSATLSREIEKLIGDFLRDPARISVKSRDTAKTVDQDIVRTRGKNKLDMLYEMLAQPEFDKVLVFGRTKHGVEKLSKLLAARGFKAASIHGNKTQSSRQKALGAFKNDQVKILVATDVAARGLDIPKVSHVINYDVPGTYDDYVHRIGRTGRAGKPGKALTFVE